MALLETKNLTARYGDFQALFGVDIALDKGETIAIIGANGAGKTTLMRSIAGILANQPNAVLFDGEAIGALPAPDIVARGIAMVPEGRKLFPSLSVEENLLIGRYGRAIAGHWSLRTVYELFPILKERRSNPGTALSGGQQQMVAIGRALMANPEVILFDEISLGLAPVVIKDIYAVLPTIVESGVSAILVEQDVSRALSVAHRFVCMQEGKVSLAGEPSQFSRAEVTAAYFGT